MTYAAVMLASAWGSHFAVILNDVFPLRWQADHLSLSSPGTFYNGFFPIGYPLLLRIVSVTGNPVLTMMLLQIAIAPMYAILVYRLLLRLAPGRAVAFVLPLSLFALPVIHAIPSATPDFFAALAALTGFIFLLREGRNRYLLAGLFLGLGCLFRSHILALIAAVALVLLLFQGRDRFKAFLGFCMGAIPFIVAQGLIQVWSGHGFFETTQAFNIWKTMHGIDWNNPPVLTHVSAAQVILDDPALFISSVWNWLFLYSFYFIPIIATIILGATQARMDARFVTKPLMMLAVATLIYLAITSAGGSISAFTPVIPIAAACTIPLFNYVFSRRLSAIRDRAISTLAVMIWIASLTGLTIFTLREVRRIEDYSNVESMLHVSSNPQAPINPNRIYTDDYDFYFPRLRYRQPRTSGGWGTIGLPDYLAAFPLIRDSSAEMEHHDLLEHGIGWAIYRIPPYDPRGYANTMSDTTLFQLIYRTPQHEVYRVKGGD